MAIAIAERDQLTAALRDREERYRQLFEAESDAIVMVNLDTSRIIDANGAAIRLYGYSRKEFLRLSPADMSGEPGQTQQAIVDHTTVVPLRWHRKSDGTAFPVEISGSYFESQGKKFHVAAIRDLTESKRAEAEHQELQRKMQESQRLESLGVLAGGIAHDFNNILSGIYGFTALARRSAGDNVELVQHLDEVARAGRRAAELVRQILAFSRAGEAVVTRVSMHQIVTEAAGLLRATVPSTITFETDLAPDLPAVNGNATQLHQIVMNLGTNAWQAMREHPGRLTVRLEACEVDEALARVLTGVSPGRFVRLIVSDTGSGMDAATQKRAFEPFFTTKPVGQGTGLGLSVVHGVVRHHQGAIRLLSEVGRGTTFEIYLPAAAAAAAPDEAAAPLAAAPGSGESILFVDDEIAIVNLAKYSLAQLGYEIVAKTRVRDALAELERAPEAFQLVITDQTMPEFTGLEFAARIRALRTDLPIVVTTGYGLELTPDRLAAAGICEVLEKPYTLETLAAMIRRRLPENGAAVS